MGARTPSGDDGFSLVEAVVAAFVLLVFSAAVASVIGNTLTVSATNRQRVAATDLATRELEIVRGEFRTSDAAALALVGEGTVVDPHPLDPDTGRTVLDGTTYTVTRSAQFAPAGSGADACAGGTAVRHPGVRVGVAVTWPGRRSVAPVRVDSLLTPSKTVLAGGYSFVAVQVRTQSGSPKVGQLVQLSGTGGTTTATTDASGCAVLGRSGAGTYSVTLSSPGHVDTGGNAVATRPVTLSAGSFQALSITYDAAASALVTLTVPPGHALPSPLPMIALGNAGLSGSSKARTFTPSGPSLLVTGLVPFPDGYTAYAGGCADADPTGPPTGGALSRTPIPPGGQAALTAALAALDVTVVGAGGAPVAGQAVSAVKPTGTTCPTGQGTLELGTTDAAGQLRASVPYGSWTIRAGNGSTSVTPSQSAAPLPVQVTLP